MSDNDNYFMKNKLLQNIKFNDRTGNKEGYVKIHSNNSYFHERVKFDVAFKLKKLGFEIWSECRFNFGGGRSDLVAIKDGKGYIVEILNSETEEQFNLKRIKYPEEFEMIKVNVKDFDIKSFEL